MQPLPAVRSATATQGACVSCRSKKLKCDRLSQSCNNCTRLGELCIVMDPSSEQFHPRSYVDGLRDKAENLRRIVNETRQSEQERITEPLPASMNPSLSTLPTVSPQYSGTGSIFSLGQLVAAAVSRGSDNSVLRLGASVAQRQQNIEKVCATEVPLPSLGDAVELMKSYFDTLHVTMPFMRQRDVFRQLERLYTGNPPYRGHEKTQDLFQLHMIFAIGAMRSPRRWKADFARDHYVTAMAKEAVLTREPAFAQIQNLLLVFVFATLHDVGIASTWEIIRQAARMSAKYGFHSHASAEEDPLREQLRRRIFWSTYISDRHSSQNFGRPVALPEDEITIDLPINLDDDGIEAGEPQAPGQYTEVTNLIRHILLRRLGTNARISLNRLSRQRASLIDQIETARKWTNALEAWYSSSVVKPTPTNAYETKEYLDINFHRERMKFLSYLVLPSNTQEVTASIEHLWQYALSAYQILLAYQRQSGDGFLVPNWTYVQDVLKSGFGILYCAVGIPEQRRQANESVGLLPSELDTLVNALKLCGQTLSQITAQWHTVKRHANAFTQMSEAVLKLIANTTRDARRNQNENPTNTGIARTDTVDETADWNFDALDSTLDMFHNDISVPFTDAEWAELFDLGPETAT